MEIQIQRVTKLSLLTLVIIWISMFSLIMFSGIKGFDLRGSVLVFAQGNETKVNKDLHKNYAISNDETSNNNNGKTRVGMILNSKPIDNCGINPSATPCCTPGKDEGCISNNYGDITISQFNTLPQKIKPDDEFKVGVTVTNNLNIPITYRGDMCGGSPLDIKFDKNVNVYNAIACQAISTETLNPHDSATVQGKGYEILRAMNADNVNIKITFNYNTENEDKPLQQIAKTFSFTIEK